MTYLVVDQRVADPVAWAADFRAAGAARARAGARPAVLLTDPDDAGRVLAVVQFASPEQARAWRTRPGMDEVMARAGIDPASVVVRVLDELLPGVSPAGDGAAGRRP